MREALQQKQLSSSFGTNNAYHPLTQTYLIVPRVGHFKDLFPVEPTSKPSSRHSIAIKKEATLNKYTKPLMQATQAVFYSETTFSVWLGLSQTNGYRAFISDSQKVGWGGGEDY